MNAEYVIAGVFSVLIVFLLVAMICLTLRNAELLKQLKSCQLREQSHAADAEEAWEKYREVKATEVWFNRYHNLRGDLLHVLAKTNEVTYNEATLNEHVERKAQGDAL